MLGRVVLRRTIVGLDESVVVVVLGGDLVMTGKILNRLEGQQILLYNVIWHISLVFIKVSKVTILYVILLRTVLIP